MKTYTLTVTTYEPLSEEEKKIRDDSSRFGGRMDNFARETPYNMREERVLHVQLSEDEFKAVKKAAVEAIS